MMKKVYVAMSGGVDSSVAAALLKSQGYSVVGVFMKFWSPFANASQDKAGTDYCLWKQERQDALRVAAKLDIPLLTWDFTHEYGEKVVNYMLEAYRAGITPNPDIMCNKEIKFGLFFNKAITEGADFVATGHYARQQDSRTASKPVSKTASMQDSETASKQDGEEKDPEEAVQLSSCPAVLLQAVDKNKDQSYFLYTLEQRHLERTLFPIGEYHKSEVRELAKKFGLDTAEKKDSQGVCFIGPLKMREFLKDYIRPKKGKIILSKTAGQQDGPTSSRLRGAGKTAYVLAGCSADRLIGEHDGVWYYTIGQRHGIDIKDGGGPYYVVGKDIEKNILYVGDESDLMTDSATVTNIHWIGDTPQLPAEIGAKIRYRGQTIPAIICSSPPIKSDSNNIVRAKRELNQAASINDPQKQNLLIKFKQAARAIAPGQAAVFYDGEKVLGGGTLL